MQLQAIAELALRFFSSHLSQENAMLNRASPALSANLLAHREREVFWYCFEQSAPGYSPSGDVCWYHQQRRRLPREIVREALKANAAAARIIFG